MGDESRVNVETEALMKAGSKKGSVDFKSFKKYMKKFEKKLPNMKQIGTMFDTMSYHGDINVLSAQEMTPLFEMLFDSSFDTEWIQRLYKQYQNSDKRGVDLNGFQRLIWTHCLGSWDKKKLLTHFAQVYC